MRKHMRILKTIIGLVLLMALLPTFHGAAEEQDNQQYIVTSQDGAKMTASADANGMVVAKLKKGARVQFVRQQDNWVKVDYNGRLGWISSELIGPFTKELLPVYSSYYKLLQNTDHIIYALVSDLTQDGVEDLYMILDSNPEKGQYQEFIYSGDQIIYQKNNTSGLTVLKNSTDYIAWHHSQTNSDKKYKLSELNGQAKTDYYEASEGKGSYEITTNAYLKSYLTLQSGNGSISEETLMQEQVASKDFYGAEKKNDYEESIYLENFSLSKAGKAQNIAERDFNELFASYEKSKIVKVIYEDDYNSAALSDRFSFDLERVKKELLDLATATMPTKQIDWDASEKEVLQEKLAQSVVLEIPFNEGVSKNATTYFKMVEQGILRQNLPGYDSISFGIVSSDLETTYNRSAVDALIYDFFGIKMNSEQFNNLANDEGYSVDDEKYYSIIKEQPEVETYTYRQLLGIETFESNYVALKFTDYEMPQEVKISNANESAILAGTKQDSGYVIFKRLPFKSGVKWAYIDTVEQLDYLDTNQYATYENSLDGIQKLIGEHKIDPTEEVNGVEEESEPVQQPITPKEQSNTWVIFLAVGILIASSIAVYRKKFAGR
ncbi:hypothetical protein DCE79_02650 [Lysinibacillus sp. 2017]|nr:hypothetical protein DCE79_02650 [Lysinibacillus sp. 2017]TGN29924.1 hypothetical protein E4L99_17775 [Lysinibacillus sp. S2017]